MWEKRHGRGQLVLAGALLSVAVAPVALFITPRTATFGSLQAPAPHGSGSPASLFSVEKPQTEVSLVVGATLVGATLGLLGLRRHQKEARLPRRGWGDDVVFHEASVKSNVEAAKGLRLITIEAPPEVSEAYSVPGQFVQAKPASDAKPSFYAISSPPSSSGSPLEFLIKEAESNEWMTGAQSGDAIQLSPAMGRGFNLKCESWEAAEVSQVGLFATGSGIAPMRAVIESGALDGKVARLYFGAQSSDSMPFTDRFNSWTKGGVEVVPVYSKSNDGRSGYVQDALKEDEERGEGFVLAARHGALLCGQKEMVAAVRSVYSDLGVPEDRTLLNF